MNNIHIESSRGKGSRKIFLLLLCLCVLITACGESPESEEVVVIDSAYLGSTTTTHPPIPYPIEIEEEFEIKVGELFGYTDFNWESIFPFEFTIANPEIVEGEGTICIIAEEIFSVFGESPGSCSLKYPSTNGGEEGFIFLTITVIAG